MSNKGFVATTVNPFGDIENQATCFNSWKRAGYSVKTFNAKKEADLLLNHGFANEDIAILDDSDTTYAKNKKYLPRIRPIVERLVHENQDVIITNSDIFALHAIPLYRVLKSLAPSLAITRREVLSLSTIDPRDNEFYRGGLDLFFFSSESLKQLKSELHNCKSADNMAFGVPGWDYLMGALIETRLNGTICDGPMVAHKYHKNTYSALDSFDIYARDIARLLSLDNSDPYWVADNYAHRINEHCKTNVKVRFSLQSFFHPNGSNKLSETNDASNIELTDFNSILNNANAKRIKQVISKVQEENDWGLANQFIPGCFVRTTPFTSKLFTLWNFLLKQEYKNKKYSTQYPEGNLHGVAIQNCMKLPEDQRDTAIFDVFATELVNHNIFNRRLFDYLVWSCNNETQIDILAHIRACIGEA